MFSDTIPLSITLYCSSVFVHGNNLANEISKINIYTKLYTVVKNEEFNISVENTPVVYLYNINNNEFKFVKFVKINNFLHMSPYYEMIEIYNILYNPSSYAQWEKYIELENMFKKRILLDKMNYKEHKKHVDGSILNIIAKRKDCVIIGKCAIDLLKDIKVSSIIQIISTKHIIKELSKILDCHIIEYNNILKTDDRLTKYILYKNKNDKKEPVMIAYNNLDYEMIPYTIYNNQCIAYLDVIAYHLFVDIYNARVYKNDNIIKNITQESLLYYSMLDTVNPSRYYRDKYLGKNYPKDVYKKKISVDSKFFPYIPEQHRYLKGNYRIV